MGWHSTLPTTCSCMIPMLVMFVIASSYSLFLSWSVKYFPVVSFNWFSFRKNPEKCKNGWMNGRLISSNGWKCIFLIRGRIDTLGLRRAKYLSKIYRRRWCTTTGMTFVVFKWRSYAILVRHDRWLVLTTQTWGTALGDWHSLSFLFFLSFFFFFFFFQSDVPCPTDVE